ncbi:Methylesterase 7 [Bienertia sinuspersici]
MGLSKFKVVAAIHTPAYMPLIKQPSGAEFLKYARDIMRKIWRNLKNLPMTILPTITHQINYKQFSFGQSRWSD